MLRARGAEYGRIRMTPGLGVEKQSQKGVLCSGKYDYLPQ